MAYIKGNFRKYIFQSDNGFTVGIIRVRETDLNIKDNTITFTGYFSELNENDLYRFEGNLVKHDKYGEQFNVTNYEVVLPEDKDHIIDFLSSELFKGIGEKKASKIVETLGVDCLTIILENPNCLLEVETVTEKQKSIIYDSLLEYKSSYDKMLNLTKIGFSMKDALRIEKYYGSNVDVVLTSPYQMIGEVKDITFSKIEKLRNKLDISIDDLDRVSAGIIYTFETISFRTGNTYFSYEEIINFSKKLLGVDESTLTKGLSNLVKLGKIIIDDDKYILMDSYESEKCIARRIALLTRNFDDYGYEDEISSISEKLGCIFNKEQKDAISSALRFNFSIITGGPGTGKTTIIKAITSIYRDINKLSRKDLLESLVLLAPTGRASKRMSTESGLPSYTIHRFLKWQKEEDMFLINEENKSDAKMVIIDEASMLDNNLFYNLLLGLKPNCKIVMIGDSNQLPSVGAGQVLKDIIESDCTPVTYLKKLYRQDKHSNINLLAHDIIEGKLDSSIFNESDDLTFVPCDKDNLKEKLEEFILTYKDLSIYDMQVLAPIYKGDNGIDALNIYIQELLNKKDTFKNELLYNGVIYREGDKVIELVNSIEDNVFNGDIREIVRVTKNKKKEITCDFDGNIVNYSPSTFENFKHGYAISIHKAQGSEFKVVILPVLTSYNFMLYRKIIYTAITRAKEKLIILGEANALKKAVMTNRDENRKTLLKNFLIDSITSE